MDERKKWVRKQLSGSSKSSSAAAAAASPGEFSAGKSRRARPSGAQRRHPCLVQRPQAGGQRGKYKFQTTRPF